jgi:NAD(P)-dependent dehydrogenase (short-subunit alcohol dehydrogenase family)
MAIALVTGASRGIGKATALQLAREGYTVAVNYHHNIKAATDVINQIVEAGGKAFAVRADISDEAQVLAMFDSLDREGEPLTALVNNAGFCLSNPPLRISPLSALTASWRPTSRATFSAAGKR